MPANKHKRKASAHVKSNKANRFQSSGLMATHPKIFVLVGLFL